MAQPPDNMLLDAITRLRDENEKFSTESLKGQKKQIKHTEEMARSIGELLDEFRNQRGDAEEARLEGKKKKGGDGDKTKTDSKKDSDFDFEWKGILAIVGGIGAAVAGFVTGFVSRWAKLFKDLGKLITTQIGKLLPKSALDFISDASKNFKSSFRTFTNFFKNLRIAFEAGFKGIRPLVRNVDGTFKALSNIELLFGGFGFGVARIVDKTKSLIAGIKSSFASIVNSIKRFFDFGTETNRVLKAFFKPLTTWFRSIIGVTESVGTFGSLFAKLGKVFKAFARVGMRLFYPLQIIMGLFDAFTGATAGMERQVGFFEKMIGGIVGAITGVLKGIIAMPLDLIKDGISWIASKLGFENFSKMLDSFSFSDLFQMVGDNLADGFVKLFHGITYIFTNAIQGLMKPFEGGFSFGGLVEFIAKIPLTVGGFLLDMFKNSISAIASIFGYEDASKAIDSFSFIDLFTGLFDNVVGRIYMFFSDMFGSITSSFTNIFDGDGSMLERIFNFAKNLYTSLVTWPFDLLKNIASGLLGFFGMDEAAQALDSFSFKDSFGKVIDYVIGLPGMLADYLMDLLMSSPVGAVMNDVMAGAMDIASQFNEWLKGIIREPLSNLAKSDDWFDKGLKAIIPSEVFDWAGVDEGTGKITAPKVSAPDTTARTDNGNRVSQMSRENEQAKSSATNVVVSAPVQSNQNVTNNSTAAIIDQNLPTVDYNDRSWGGNLTWQGGVGLV